MGRGSLSYKGPGSENDEKISPSLTLNRIQGESGLSKGCPLSLSAHSTRSDGTEDRSWKSNGWEMSQEASQWPQGSPSKGPAELIPIKQEIWKLQRESRKKKGSGWVGD